MVSLRTNKLAAKLNNILKTGKRKVMTKNEILNTLKELKPKYTKEGFIILGLFGSYARDEANDKSDVDILYDLDEQLFLKNFAGFKAFGRLGAIKDELKEVFNANVDIADISTLNSVGKKYILPEAIYV